MYSALLKASIISAGLILFAVPINVSAANLSISPTSGTFEVGQKVTVRVLVSSGAAINAVSGIVSFPSSIFSIESVSKVGSILNFWVTEPNFSHGAGTLQFEGVTLGGWSGGTGVVVTAVLKAVKSGTGTITFELGQVLANDGQGTDVTDGKTGATFSVEPAKDVPKPALQPEAEEVDIPQPKPSLNSPEIVLTNKYGEKAISGVSNYPYSQVLLTFASQEGVKIFITGTTDNLGQFLLLVPQTLKRGTYKVSAIVIQGNLANSHASNEIAISIGNIISDISWEIRLAILGLFLALIYLIVRSYHYLKRNRKLKASVRKEAQEAEKIVHESFKLIREDIKDTKSVKKDLDDAEELINKEIKDIEKL